MINTKERLDEALRQYRHNNSDEFVAGYDLQLIAKLVEDLEQENANLRATLGGAAPQPELAEPSGPARYRIDKTGSGFWPFCVRAGDGTRELFVGHLKTCERVAAELAVAFEDGKFVATRHAQRESALAFKEELLKASKIFLHPFIEGVYAVFETQQREGGA